MTCQCVLTHWWLSNPHLFNPPILMSPPLPAEHLSLPFPSAKHWKTHPDRCILGVQQLSPPRIHPGGCILGVYLVYIIVIIYNNQYFTVPHRIQPEPVGTTWNHSDSKLDPIFHLDSDWNHLEPLRFQVGSYIPPGFQLDSNWNQLESTQFQLESNWFQLEFNWNWAECNHTRKYLCPVIIY